MKRYVIIGAMLALVGCQTAESMQAVPRPITAGERQLVTTYFSRTLKDPESARFVEMQTATTKDGHVFVCGLVNAKNSFGGYTGSVPYSGFIKSGRFTLYSYPQVNDSFGYGIVSNYCKRAGLDLGIF